MIVLLIYAMPLTYYASQLVRSHLAVALLFLVLLSAKSGKLVVVPFITHGAAIAAFFNLKIIEVYAKPASLISRVIILLSLGALAYYFDMGQLAQVISVFDNDFFGRLGYYVEQSEGRNINFSVYLVAVPFVLGVAVYARTVVPLALLVLAIGLEIYLEAYNLFFLRLFPLLSVFLPILLLYTAAAREKQPQKNTATSQPEQQPERGFTHSMPSFLAAAFSFSIVVNRVVTAALSENPFQPFIQFSVFEPLATIWLAS